MRDGKAIVIPIHLGSASDNASLGLNASIFSRDLLKKYRVILLHLLSNE